MNPDDRLSANEALSHEWMKADDAKLESRDLQSNLSHLKLFNARRKFKMAIKSVIFTKRLSSRQSLCSGQSELSGGQPALSSGQLSTQLAQNKDVEGSDAKMDEMDFKEQNRYMYWI